LILVNFREVKAVLFKNLRRRLSGQLFEDFVNLTALPTKDLEFFRLDDKLILSALTYKSLQKLSTLFDEALLLISDHLLLGDGGYIAAWPTIIQYKMKREKFVVATLNFESSF
jgi:hypothetical protein